MGDAGLDAGRGARMRAEPERADVVIVGARCAGSAAAIVLARAGRRVVVLDKTRFPSDTLSTHALLPNGVSQLARIGALERVLALNPARSTLVHMQSGRAQINERWRPVDGIDYGLCVPRTVHDMALVETARAVGAEVRERCEVERVLWRAGRVVGVEYRDGDELRAIRAPLVIGADGRRSTVVAQVGAWRPYRASRNGRGLAFRYMDDPMVGTEWHRTMSHWREGNTIGFTFPCCPEGRLLLLWMGPAEEIARFRRETERVWSEKLRLHANGLALRVEGATNLSKLRSTADTPAFFRASSGPGWALAGDAGHFKDPVIGQGMRDAMYAGRLLGEMVVDRLEDPQRLDATLRRWEQVRDREMLPSYHWANRESRPIPPSALFREVISTFRSREPDAGDSFNRVRTPERVVGPSHLVRGLAGALMRSGDSTRLELLREALGELPAEIDIRRERWSGGFRSTRPTATERQDWSLPAPPQGSVGSEPGAQVIPLVA